MGTTTYFKKYVKDDGDLKGDRQINLVVGTTNFAGVGPQMFLRLGDSEAILSHDDAKDLFRGIEEIASYFGYWKDLG